MLEIIWIVFYAILKHLAEMPGLANRPNTDLSKGFRVSHVAESMLAPLCPVKFLPRETSLLLLFNWGMRVTVYQVKFTCDSVAHLTKVKRITLG